MLDSPVLTRGFHFKEDLAFSLEKAPTSNAKLSAPLSSRLLKLASNNPVFQEVERRQQPTSDKNDSTNLSGVNQDESHGAVGSIRDLLSRRKVPSSDANNVSNDLDFFGLEEYSSQNSSIIMFELELGDSSTEAAQSNDKNAIILDQGRMKPVMT